MEVIYEKYYFKQHGKLKKNNNQNNMALTYGKGRNSKDHVNFKK